MDTPLDVIFAEMDRQIGEHQAEAVRGTSYPMSRRYNPAAFYAQTDDDLTTQVRKDYGDELTERYGPYPSDATVIQWAEDRALDLFRTRAEDPLPTRVQAALDAATATTSGAPGAEPTADLQALGLLPLVPSLAVFVRHVETMQGNPDLYTDPDRAALAYAAGVYRTEALESGDLLAGIQGLLDQSPRQVEERRHQILVIVLGVAFALGLTGALWGVAVAVRRWRVRRGAPALTLR
ncbi:hypothetical protein [Rubrivirga litoralis]|uniref:Uncharacterized protein n=1 Tax=Rubrivirga litoralis TaxID=3075598 RepID=A0ABU3BM98_9BACT|nr:hypothetical protein [Rubrivirga sp. F394]MDT0630406.1 hypothetical protein [Rubrivirga sp. F394]